MTTGMRDEITSPVQRGRFTMPTDVTPADVAKGAALFKTLSHPDRLMLACVLGDGRVTTQTQLVKELGWPQSTVARHLDALRKTGLVKARREGAEVTLRMGNDVGIRLMETVCAWVHPPTPDHAQVRESARQRRAVPSKVPSGAGPSPDEFPSEEDGF